MEFRTSTQSTDTISIPVCHKGISLMYHAVMGFKEHEM